MTIFVVLKKDELADEGNVLPMEVFIDLRSATQRYNELKGDQRDVTFYSAEI